jgi:hypothetical protein
MNEKFPRDGISPFFIQCLVLNGITFLTSIGRVPWPPPTCSKQEKYKIEMWSAWWILWALTYQIHVVAGKHQAAINSSMNNCRTKHRVMLPTSKLNSSDSQVSGAGIGGGIFLLPLQEKVTPALFKNVMGSWYIAKLLVNNNFLTGP